MPSYGAFFAESVALHVALVRSRRNDEKCTVSAAQKMPRANRATQNNSEPPFVHIANKDKGDKKSLFLVTGPPVQHSAVQSTWSAATRRAAFRTTFIAKKFLDFAEL